MRDKSFDKDTNTLPAGLYRHLCGLIDDLIQTNNGKPVEELTGMFIDYLELGLEHTIPQQGVDIVLGWLDCVGDKEVEKLILYRMALNKSRKYPSATENQLDIIRETQAQVGVDFSDYFPELTTRQADVICKGLILTSEVIRQTGRPKFRLGDIRRAIRHFVDKELSTQGEG